MTRNRVVTPLWLAGVILASALAIGGAAGAMLARGPAFTVAAASDAPEVAFNGIFAPAVKAASPSVVNISSSRIVARETNPLFNDPFFQKFFGDSLRQFGVPRDRRERSLGSGVIVSPDGYVLTNSHVVQDATDIQVFLSDRRQFPARIIGVDPKTDLALVKMDQDGLIALPLADSSRVEVGDVALAMGNPFGIGRTVTMGIISATGRGDLGIEDYED